MIDIVSIKIKQIHITRYINHAQVSNTKIVLDE
jgi:hypothetical protein